jgi:hypothetical protein
MPIKPLDRRTFLQGMGVSLSLPFLEAMLPMNKTWAASPSRFAALYIGNGMLSGRSGAGSQNDYWSCQGSATGITSFSTPVQKLAAFKDYLTVVQNCSFDNLSQNEGDAGHEQASPGFLCGQNIANDQNVTPPTATSAQVSRLSQAGMSIDRMISAKRSTRLRNLMMAMGPNNNRFANTYGYAQMLTTLSWDSQTAHLNNDTLRTASDVFKQLTGSGLSGQAPNTGAASDAAKAAAQKKSVLDAVLGDVNTLQARLGSADKQVMGQYLDSVRKLETDLQSQISTAPPVMAGCSAPTAAKQAAYKEDATLNFNHITPTAQYMCELMTLAFQCGITDVSTLMLSYDWSLVPGAQLNAAYGAPNVAKDNYHNTTHYASDGAVGGGLEAVQGVNLWHAVQLANLAQMLKSTPDSDGRTLLDNSMILFGAGMGDPDTHTFGGMMRLLVGKGGGLNPGPNGKLINAGGGNAHPKLLQTILAGFGISDRVGISGGSTIAGIIG